MHQLRQTARADLRRVVKGGATTRILDLYSIARKHGHTDEHGEEPFFHNSRLNRCFIIKHTVRAHERSYVMSNQPVVTKILIPLAEEDLALGGHAVFVEEIGFANKIRSHFEIADDPHLTDLDLLRLRELASIPSFDPFLLSERFRNHPRPVADCYFDITEDESRRMIDSVAGQILGVVALAFGDGEKRGKDDARAMNFARQLLSSEDNGKLEFLRLSLDMSPAEFKSGIFGWKGILYYRWCMTETLNAVKDFLRQLSDLTIVNANQTEMVELEHMRRTIISETRARWSNLTMIMQEYETVFARFCAGEDARGFQDFLLKAPNLFYDIGSDLSVVSHIPGYWRYWDDQNAKGYFHAREAMPLFASFVASVTRERLTESSQDVPRTHRSTSVIPRPEVFVPPAA